MYYSYINTLVVRMGIVLDNDWCNRIPVRAGFKIIRHFIHYAREYEHGSYDYGFFFFLESSWLGY